MCSKSEKIKIQLYFFGTQNDCSTTNALNTKTIKIFLASSAELKSDRDDLRLFVSVENDRLHEKGVYLKLIQWEYFLDAVSDTRMQNEYNKALRDCDIVLSLFHTRAGKYTQEEFETALRRFKETGKPLIYTYFKDATDKMIEASLLEFKERLHTLGHFPTNYSNIDDLKVQFKRQLEIIIDNSEPEIQVDTDKMATSNKSIIQNADKIYNINHIYNANFS